MNIKNCINCNSRNLSKFLNSEINPSYLLKKQTLICQNCGLAFKDVRINDKNYTNSIKLNYYSKFKKLELEKRFKARIIFDKTRAKHYYEFINKRIDFKKINNVLDIGGAEGWFANYIKTNHPNLNVYNLDPDKNAIKFGKFKYPNIKHICRRLEDLDKIKLKKIDLFTYWGGFYRTAQPSETLYKLYKSCNTESNLFLTLPYSFGNPLRQHNEKYGSLDEIIGNGSLIFLNDFYIERLFEKYFKFCEKKIIQNYPFQKKIPIFHFNKRKNKNKLIYKYNKKSYDYSYNFLTTYCLNNSILNLNIFFKKNNIKKIAIWACIKYEKDIYSIFKKTKIKNLTILNEDNWYYKKNKSIDSFYKLKKLDALVIADFKKQNIIIDQLKNRLHIDNVKIIKLLNEKYIYQNIFESLDGKNILKKVFIPSIVI